ncbi:MAG: RES family NAD+ phosphorylase [Gammaproteobacteria bacterium]|nr:RES family NAD+ phosphorylase [Gammaproteobacteria bacterium]MCP4981054.1 RES family NAD+ phosphorylase [Gammaproteobacteria bacterium]
MIGYRHADPRFPFLWETDRQPAARWHADHAGPAHYFSDTPYGAWAEFLRHEGITDTADLPGIRRAIWAVELGAVPTDTPTLSDATLRGGLPTYAACQCEAQRLRARGKSGLRSPSAALRPGGASGWQVNAGLTVGPHRNGQVFVLFGARPDLVGWQVVETGQPPDYLLSRVRSL